MRLRYFNIALAVAFVLLAGACMSKGERLVYPQEVFFFSSGVPYKKGQFEACNWMYDAKNPRPCPLVVHLPTGDLKHADFADAAALQRAGWEKTDNGHMLLRTGQAFVNCYYEGGILTGVAVSTVGVDGPIEFSVDGKRLSLPAKEAEITAVMGQPLRRN